MENVSFRIFLAPASNTFSGLKHHYLIQIHLPNRDTYQMETRKAGAEHTKEAFVFAVGRCINPK